MSIRLTVDAICNFLEQRMAQLLLTSSNGDEQIPQIIKGWLPFKKSEKDITYPFIIVRPIQGDVHNGPNEYKEYIIYLRLIFGSYSDPKQDEDYSKGQYDLYNMIERTKYMLETTKFIENRYQVMDPIKWAIPEEQFMPYWLASMDIQIQSPVLREGIAFGENC